MTSEQQTLLDEMKNNSLLAKQGKFEYNDPKAGKKYELLCYLESEINRLHSFDKVRDTRNSKQRVANDQVLKAFGNAKQELGEVKAFTNSLLFYLLRYKDDSSFVSNVLTDVLTMPEYAEARSILGWGDKQ